MDKDAIIREWFYRLPKGYANAPYSKEELNILHTVLEENGLNGSAFVNEVDQLDQAFNDAEEVDMEDKKHAMEELQEWKEDHKHLINEEIKLSEIVKLLSDVKNRLDQDDLTDIQSVIIRSAFKGKVLKYFANKQIVPDAYQLGDKSVRILFNTISSLPNVDQVVNYFESPKKLVIGDDGRGSLEDSGLPKETLLKMMTMQPGADRGGNATGPGEVALSLLFSNVTNYTGGGDLEFDGNTLEVKGKDARLGQQSRGKRNLESTFLGFMIESAVANQILTEEEADEYLNDSDHNNISIAIRDGYELLVEEKKQDKKEFIERVVKGVGAIFFENLSVAQKYLDEASDFKNVNSVMKQLVKINLEAYMDKIKTSQILFHNFRKGKSNDLRFALVKREDIDSVVEAGTIRLGSQKSEGSFFWNNTNPSVKLKLG
jgi:hypothetical protein